MTGIESHIHTDAAIATADHTAPHLGAEISATSDREYNAAKAASPTTGGEAVLGHATISPTAIHFGKASDHEASGAPAAMGKVHKVAAKANDFPPDADHPVQSARALMQMEMTQGEFDRVPKALVPLAEKLGQVGMVGLSADEHKDVAKLYPYMDQQPESLTMDNVTSNAVRQPAHFTEKEIDAEGSRLNAQADYFGNQNNVSKIPF